MELNNAVALITGGSEGIGRAIAEALIAEGAIVTITGRRKDFLQLTAEETGADWIAGDVSVEADAVHTVSEVIRKHGRLDILVNNAGFGLFKPLVDNDLGGAREGLSHQCLRSLPHGPRGRPSLH